MNEPPLPQPHRYTCPKCGFGFDAYVNYCPNCGAPVGSNKVTAASSTATILLQIGLCLIALCSGGFGACAFLLGGFEGTTRISSEVIFFSAIPILISGLCIWGVFRLGRRKK